MNDLVFSAVMVPMVETPDLTPSLPKAETLAVSKKLTVVFESIDDDKIKVSAQPWPDGKVMLKGEVFEVRTVWGGLRFARKERFPDEKDIPVAPYDCYGPGPDDIVLDDTAGDTKGPE